MTTIDIELISDYICPWCYIGKVRLERLQSKLSDEFYLNIDIKPYVLYPHIPPGGSPKSEFSQKTKPGMGRSLRTEAKTENIEINYKMIDRIPYSLPAHRLTWLVSDTSKKYQLAKMIFQGYFEEGKNIEDSNYLIDLARSINLEESTIKQFQETSEGQEEIKESTRTTKDQFVTVVPSMRLEKKFIIPGLQTSEVWENYIRRAARLKK